MKLLCLLLIMSASVFAKTANEKELYEFKVKQEQALIKLKGKTDFDFFNTKSFFINTKMLSNIECIEFVYRGPSSREESIAACRGVRNMGCVEWVYRGPSSRVESAQACRRVFSMECPEFVYRGPSSRLESVAACRGVRDMECVRFTYRGPHSRVESARMCAEGRRPRDPRCD